MGARTKLTPGVVAPLPRSFAQERAQKQAVHKLVVSRGALAHTDAVGTKSAHPAPSAAGLASLPLMGSGTRATVSSHPGAEVSAFLLGGGAVILVLVYFSMRFRRHQKEKRLLRGA